MKPPKFYDKFTRHDAHRPRAAREDEGTPDDARPPRSRSGTRRPPGADERDASHPPHRFKNNAYTASERQTGNDARARNSGRAKDSRAKDSRTTDARTKDARAKDVRPSRVARIVQERWSESVPRDSARPQRGADDRRGMNAERPPQSDARRHAKPHSASKFAGESTKETGNDSTITADRFSSSDSIVSDAAHLTAASFIHGVKPVLEALRAGARPLERLLILETARDGRLREIVERAHAANVPVRHIGASEIERIAGAGSNHQGIVALIAAARYRDTDELLESLAANANAAETNRQHNSPLVVVLDGVEDPRNLGAIIRTVECAGGHAVFVPERRAAGLTETVAKTAAGALEYVPVARVQNTVDLLARLKAQGVWTIGTAADAETDYTAWDWRTPSALVLGGEGAGLRRLVRERCDALVRIPLLGRIESLNVSVAAAVVLYEAIRQRRATSGEAASDAATSDEATSDGRRAVTSQE